MPPLAVAAVPRTMASGGTATPCPNATVITADWPQLLNRGSSGRAASGSSTGTRSKKPICRSQSCWRRAPASSAMCAAAGFDDSASASGMASQGAKWSVFMSLMVKRPTWIGRVENLSHTWAMPSCSTIAAVCSLKVEPGS